MEESRVVRHILLEPFERPLQYVFAAGSRSAEEARLVWVRLGVGVRGGEQHLNGGEAAVELARPGVDAVHHLQPSLGDSGGR
eukprot:scaffold3235_cov84-Isochrysis_galbana.AAC.1